jgi:hypothetical protein
LEPAGVDGFYQPVKFESRQVVEKDSSLALVRDGKKEALTLGDDDIFSTRVDLAPSVRCVRSAMLRASCKVLTWQELASCLPAALQVFLSAKYGIVPVS